MSAQWPIVPLSEVLTEISRPVQVSPGTTYRILGAHWYAKGLYVKEEKDGSEIRASTLYEVIPGDFVYNRLFAWKGAFAVATEAERNCLVSNEFPCFYSNAELADVRWIHLYFSLDRTWSQALALSSGGTPTSRNRLKERQFLEMTIPLPPIEEQCQIVELQRKLGEVMSLQRKILSATEAVIPSLLSRLLERGAEL
jgi:type I restriction enzyme S subunit